MKIEKELSTSRITARNSLKSDLPYLTAMWFDEENGKYTSDPTGEYVDDVFRKAVDGIEENTKGYYLTVRLKDLEKIIGSGFIFPDEKIGHYEIAYCIHKNYWRMGYGSEVVALLIRWIKEHGGTEVTAEVAKENTASNELLKKAGFEIVGESEFKKYNMSICFESNIYRLELK